MLTSSTPINRIYKISAFCTVPGAIHMCYGLDHYEARARSARRSTSVKPPAIPNAKPALQAHARHSDRTGQRRHTALAAASSPGANTSPRGKKISGSASRQAARCLQSLITTVFTTFFAWQIGHLREAPRCFSRRSRYLSPVHVRASCHVIPSACTTASSRAPRPLACSASRASRSEAHPV